MSGDLLVFAGSLAGVAVLVLASRLLGLGSDAKIADESEARELAENAVPGFDPHEVALDATGRAALVRDRPGRIVLLAPHGARFVGRLLAGPPDAARRGGRLTVNGVTLELGSEAAAWAARLAPRRG